MSSGLLLVLAAGCGAETPGSSEDDCSNADQDFDSHSSNTCGGDDCDDGDPLVHPGADDGGWVEDELAPLGGFPVVVMDATGAAHFFFSRSVAGPLFHASEGEDGWIEEEIFSGCVDGTVDAVADEAGAVHVTCSQYDPSQAIVYATNATDQWVGETVAESAAGTTLVAIGVDGTVHVIYSRPDPAEVLHASKGTGGWSTESIPGIVRAGLSLGVGPDGALHLAGNLTWYGSLEYATNASGAWTVEEVAHRGWGARLGVDSSGTVHVTYVDADEYRVGDLRRLSRAGGDWQSETVAQGVDPRSGAPALELTPDGAAHLAWGSDALHDELVHATNESGSWLLEAVRPLRAGLGAPRWMDLAVAGDSVAIAYWIELRGVAYARRVHDGIDQDCDGSPDE